MEPITLSFAIVNTELLEILESNINEFVLHEHHIEFNVRCRCKFKDDEDDDWKEKTVNHSISALKRNIAGIDVYWQYKEKSWQISISISGKSGDMWSSVASKKEGMEFRDKIYSWLFNNQDGYSLEMKSQGLQIPKPRP